MSYFTWTGNPWVDAGVSALCALSRKDDPESITLDDVKQAARYVAELYPRWAMIKGGGFTKVFHNFAPFNFSLPTENSFREQLSQLENEFIQKHGGAKTKALKDPQFKQKKKEIQERSKQAKKSLAYREKVFQERYEKFVTEFLSHLAPKQAKGACVGCGSADVDYRLQRDKHPMLGSGDLVNYFSFFEDGLGFCANCTFAIQFAPLSLVQIENWLCAVHSHEPKIMLARRNGITYKALQHFNARVAAKRKITFYDPNIKARSLPEAIVRLAVDLTEDTEILQLENVGIRLYRFSNAGQTANISFVDLPAPVFRFIARTKQRGLKSNLEELFRYGGLDIFQRLTDNQSIKYFFFDRENKLIRGGWKLFELYLKEVDEMDQDNFQTIISVADRIYDYVQKTNLKPLKEMEQANYPEFRRVLLSIHKVFPICTSKDLPIILSFDNWNERRDMILFRIYERQHNGSAFAKEVESEESRDRLRARLPVELEKRLLIADRIFDYCVLQNHKNRLEEIEQSIKYPEFRKALLAIQRETLICYAEDLPLLFPKDELGRVYWEDVRDTLLFRIYERKHQISSTTTQWREQQ